MIQEDFYLGKPGFWAVGVPEEAGGQGPAGAPPPPSAPRYLRATCALAPHGAAQPLHPLKIEKNPSRKPKANP